jgi:uncharacterized membrane protein YccF (DUF307 family)
MTIGINDAWFLVDGTLIALLHAVDAVVAIVDMVSISCS